MTFDGKVQNLFRRKVRNFDERCEISHFYRREARTNISYLAYHKSSLSRGRDGCTSGADLRVCGLCVRSCSLAANHAGGPGYILLPA